MATIRKYWRCSCRNHETGKARGYKKIHQGEASVTCPHCQGKMYLADANVARVTVNGQTKTFATPRKADASAYIDECRRAKRTGNLLPGEEPIITWEEGAKIFTQWAESAASNKEISANSLKYYKTGLKPLNRKFEGWTLQDIEKRHGEQFKNERMKEVSPSTVNCSLATLKRVFTIVCDDLRARDYPRLHEAKTDVFKVKLLETNNANETFLETDEEIQALLYECRTLTLFKFVFSILNTGLRPGFAFSLKKSDFDFRANQIRKTVKGGTRVTIPLTEQYKIKVQQWFKELKVCPLDPWLIPSPVDPSKCMVVESNIGFHNACLRAAAKLRKAGQRDAAQRLTDLTPHNLRHTFATHYLYKAYAQHGNALAAYHDLAKILGHTTTYITERYSHVLDTMAQGAMKTYGDNIFTNIDHEPRLIGQGQCSCGAFLSLDGECSKCGKGVGNNVGNKSGASN